MARTQTADGKFSIAGQNAVSHRNDFLTDRIFSWFCGKNLGDTLTLIKCSTVHGASTVTNIQHHSIGSQTF